MMRLMKLWWLTRRNIHLLWHAAHHPRRPVWLLPALVILALYCIEPLNFAIPFLGVVDDLILLPIALNLLIGFLPRELLAEQHPES